MCDKYTQIENDSYTSTLHQFLERLLHSPVHRFEHFIAVVMKEHLSLYSTMRSVNLIMCGTFYKSCNSSITAKNMHNNGVSAYDCVSCDLKNASA